MMFMIPVPATVSVRIATASKTMLMAKETSFAVWSKDARFSTE